MEPKQQPPYPLRMPPDLRAELEKMAAESKRSLNAEIVAHLAVSVMRSLNPSRHSESLSRLALLSRRIFEMEAQLMTIEEIRTVRKERVATAKKNNQDAEDISSLAAEVAQADRVIRGLKVEMEAYLARYKKLEAEIAQENKAT